MRRIKVFLIVALMVVGAAKAGATEVPPAKVIGEFHDILLNVMKGSKSSTAKERYGQLEPAIEKAFNLGFMIRAASGTAWRKASDAHKADLAKAFRRMSIATYAFRFKGYSGQRFETLRTGDGPRKMQLVYTHIVSPKKNKRDESVKLTYVTKKFKESWRIVDILLDGGISELSVKHSEYRTILKTKGAGALATLLDKKADQLIAP
jgi:phospholipid transport system substrate-binding protein